MYVSRFIPLLFVLLANSLPSPRRFYSNPLNRKCDDDASGDYYKCEGYDDSLRSEFYIQPSHPANSMTDHSNCIEYCSGLSNCGGFVVSNPLEDAASTNYTCHFRNHVWIGNVAEKIDDVDVRSTWVTYIKKGEKFVKPVYGRSIWNGTIWGRCVDIPADTKERKFFFSGISLPQCQSLCLQDFLDCKGIVYYSESDTCELQHTTALIDDEKKCEFSGDVDYHSLKLVDSTKYRDSK